MKRFFALSRTTHGILDIAAPAFCALLWLGKFPSWQTLLLSLLTAFAGYTAIYALNDLVGVRGDREKFAGSGINQGYSVEASDLRYPLAQNVLSYRSGWIWCAAWFLLALAGSYILNPAILIIVFAAAFLETAYCLLFKVTYWRTLVSGLVKASGPVAAVFVVDHNPPVLLLLLQIAWLIFWEIGGQNIPADWNDVAEDRRVHAKTIPLQFGAKKAGLIVIIALTLSVITSLFLPLISPMRLGILYLLASLLAGYFLLLQPGFQLFQSRESRQAAGLFDKASYYPLTQLVLISLFIILFHPG
ncbi:MAG: UbiA family prenyltransferase [Anaerolineales bacterium]